MEAEALAEKELEKEAPTDRERFDAIRGKVALERAAREVRDNPSLRAMSIDGRRA